MFLCTLFLFSFCVSEKNKTLPADAPGKPAKGSGTFMIAFYNVENLFDTHDDPGTDDAEFLPEGKNNWTNERYKTKSDNIAHVIGEMNEGKGADIVGLSEVENMDVIKDLVSHPQLKGMDYGIVHRESPDTRGIDVAMIYKKKSFRLIGTSALRVDISQFESRPTRDIILVQGVTSGKDTLYIFLNHWPSRRGGTRETQPRRQAAATVLRKAVDSILLRLPNAKLVAMGDFNDNPSDATISQTLGATKIPDLSVNNSLYDPANNFDWKAGEGSEFYRGDWSRFIQIIVSTSLVKNQLDEQKNFHDIYIFKPQWLLVEDAAYQQMVPYRTFDDQKPIGFSDHLPVYVKLQF
ncbi:MAG: endonuclease/exonuclease/phosphatase family protein [Chitinophagales bacterium]